MTKYPLVGENLGILEAEASPLAFSQHLEGQPWDYFALNFKYINANK